MAVCRYWIQCPVILFRYPFPAVLNVYLSAAGLCQLAAVEGVAGVLRAAHGGQGDAGGVAHRHFV